MKFFTFINLLKINKNDIEFFLEQIWIQNSKVYDSCKFHRNQRWLGWERYWFDMEWPKMFMFVFEFFSVLFECDGFTMNWLICSIKLSVATQKTSLRLSVTINPESSTRSLSYRHNLGCISWTDRSLEFHMGKLFYDHPV